MVAFRSAKVCFQTATKGLRRNKFYFFPVWHAALRRAKLNESHNLSFYLCANAKRLTHVACGKRSFAEPKTTNPCLAKSSIQEWERTATNKNPRRWVPAGFGLVGRRDQPLTSIRFGCAAWTFGAVTVSTPSL